MARHIHIHNSIYFQVPLISFWTLVLYISLSVPPRITWATCDVNSLNYLYLVLKIVGIISFITILYISEACSYICVAFGSFRSPYFLFAVRYFLRKSS